MEQDSGPRRPRRAAKGGVRPVLLFVHRWLTFLLGIVLVAVAGSGALLVYQWEIDQALNAHRYDPTPGDVGWEAVAETLREAHPDAQMELLWWPRWNVPVYEGHLALEDGSYRTVGVDPGTGEILPPAGQRNRIMEGVSAFHTSLLADTAGYWLVVSSTLAGIFLAVTGLWLWWPGLRRFSSGFRIRRRSFYTLNFDLHQVAGAVTAPLVLAMAITGIAIAFPQATRNALHVLTGEATPEEVYWTEVRSGPRPEDYRSGDGPDYDSLLAHAHREVPGAETFYVTFPAEDDDPIHIRLQTGIEPKPFGIVSRLAYDRYTGELIQVVDPRRTETRAGAALEWIDVLHFGHFWGHVGRGAYVLTCLMLLGLFAGGLYLWWEKRRRRVVMEKRRLSTPGSRGAAGRAA